MFNVILKFIYTLDKSESAISFNLMSVVLQKLSVWRICSSGQAGCGPQTLIWYIYHIPSKFSYMYPADLL